MIIHKQTCMHAWTHECTHAWTHTHTHTHTNTYSVHRHKYTHTLTHVCTHIHTILTFDPTPSLFKRFITCYIINYYSCISTSIIHWSLNMEDNTCTCNMKEETININIIVRQIPQWLNGTYTSSPNTCTITYINSLFIRQCSATNKRYNTTCIINLHPC